MNGKTEYWLTALVFKPGDTLDRNGKRWIVTSIGETNGTTKHMFVTLRQDGDLLLRKTVQHEER